MADVFEALATPARRAILDELHERDGQTLFELCARLAMKHDLGLTRQAISQHLDVLESAGVITTPREGRKKVHYLDTGPPQGIFGRELKKPPGRQGGHERGKRWRASWWTTRTRPCVSTPTCSVSLRRLRSRWGTPAG